jgi:hypothetical protein
LIAACLLAAICDAASATTGQKDPGVAEAIRQQVEGFSEKDLLRVKLHDNSERLGCLRTIELDGLVIGTPKGDVQTLLYGDIAAVAKEQTRRPNFLRRTLIPLAAVAGVIFGTAKIGSNTPKTVALKIYVGSGVGAIAGQALIPRVITCH